MKSEATTREKQEREHRHKQAAVKHAHHRGNKAAVNSHAVTKDKTQPYAQKSKDAQQRTNEIMGNARASHSAVPHPCQQLYP